VGELLKTLHLVRQPQDELAWEAIRISANHGQILVVLIEDAAYGQPPPGITAVTSPPVEYDEIVAMMEWADKVVVW
jgi:hypothetical protein